MWTYEELTLTDLHEAMTLSLLKAGPDELDVISSVDVQKHAVVGVAESMVWDFDLKTMWLTPSRWTMMARQYIDPEELKAWIEKCTAYIGTKGRGTAVMRTKIVKPRGGAATGHTNKETRRWGSCMLALSYKALPQPTITLHSRTSYLGYIGALDLTVAWMAARYLAHELGVEVERFKFVWMIESIQWHNFKSLAFILVNPNKDIRDLYRPLLLRGNSKLEPWQTQMLEDSPALRLSRKWLRNVMLQDQQGLTYGDMNYNTYRRIRRRWHTEVFGLEHAQQFEGWSYYKQGEKAGQEKEFFKAYQPLPNCHVSTLDFGRLGLPLGGTYGVDFAGDPGEDDDDDE